MVMERTTDPLTRHSLEFLDACVREHANGEGMMPRLVLLDLKLSKVD